MWYGWCGLHGLCVLWYGVIEGVDGWCMYDVADALGGGCDDNFDQGCAHHNWAGGIGGGSCLLDFEIGTNLCHAHFVGNGV